MAEKIEHNGELLERGEKVTKAKGQGKGGKGWRLVTTSGKKRYFVASLIESIEVGGEQVLIFRVSK